MKAKLTIPALVLLIATSCGTSTQLSKGYVDDLYYWPGDEIPVAQEVLNSSKTEARKKADSDYIVISEMKSQSDTSKQMNNFIYADDAATWYNDSELYNPDQFTHEGTDTLYNEDENTTYIVNNYFMDDDSYYYTSRIRRFHNPYYYSPGFYFGSSFYWDYYDPWYSWSYDPWYYDSYCSWYSPWGWNSPYYYSYWGGYNSFYYGYSPYSYYSWGYYNGWHDGSYWGGTGHANGRDYHYGPRRSERPNSYYGPGGASAGSSTALNDKSTDGAIRTYEGRRAQSVSGGSLSQVTDRNATSTSAREKSAVLTEYRRNGSISGSSNNGEVQATPVESRRSASVRTEQPSSLKSTAPSSYSTPSYNKPRTNIRATYNTTRTTTQGTAPASSSSSYQRSVQSTRSSASGSVSSSPAATQSRSYRSTVSTPSSSSSRSSGSSNSYSTPSRSNSYSSPSNSSYSSPSNSSYSSPSRSSSSGSSYSSPSRSSSYTPSSSGSSYSAPSRSSSSSGGSSSGSSSSSHRR